jgi:hypothetical protein
LSGVIGELPWIAVDDEQHELVYRSNSEGVSMVYHDIWSLSEFSKKKWNVAERQGLLIYTISNSNHSAILARNLIFPQSIPLAS